MTTNPETAGVEPVAWQRRKQYALAGDPPGKQYQWEYCSRQEATGHFDRQPGYEYRSLYAHPPAAREDGESSTLPDIGPDPFKGPREEYTLTNAEKRLRDAFTVQQKGVPDQTALVWRCDLLKVFHELPRLRSIEEDWRETRAALAAMPTPAAIRAETTAQIVAWISSLNGDQFPTCTAREILDVVATAIERGAHLTGGGD